ncbi:MAG: DUF1508 domain-containing protein [Pseudomonadota bacterium]
MAGEDDTFEVYQDKRGEYRWRRKAKNGQIVGAASEGYTKKSDCEANMKRGPNPKDKWEFYKDKRGEFRWRRRASNGAIIGASSEGYTKRGDCEANAARQGYKA